MGEKVLVLVFGVVVLALTFFLSRDQGLTGYIVTDDQQTLEVALDASKFATSAVIDGTLTIRVAEELDPSEFVVLTVWTQTSQFTINDLLLRTNATVEYEAVQYNATNETNEKKVTFTGPGSQYLALKLPRYAEVSDVSLTMKAGTVGESAPSAVTIDVGNEGNVDWRYLGEFLQYSATSIASEDLDGSEEGTGLIQDVENYYCEFLSLPATKHVKISASYTKTGTVGDLYATVISVPTGSPKVGWSGGADVCDLPEKSDGSCTITFAYPLDEDQYLVCLYAKELGEYSLPLDTSQETDTAFTCPVQENSVCKSTGFSNFFISVSPGVYDTELSGRVDFATWETFPGAVVTGVKYYVGSSPYTGLCKTTTCSVPLNITSQSAGTLVLKNLVVTYTYNDVTQTTTAFSDLQIPTANIEAVNGEYLEDGVTIEIPIALFGISLSAVGDYELNVSFLGETVSVPLSVREVSDVLDASTLIGTALSRYQGFLDQSSDDYQILVMLDDIGTVQNTYEELEEVKNQIGFVSEAEVLGRVEETIGDVPWEISSVDLGTWTISLDLDDIPAGFGDEEEVYETQDAVTVLESRETVTVETYDEQQSTYTFVHLLVTAEEDLDDAEFTVIAPLGFDDLLYTPRPTSVIGDQAVYTLSLTSGNAEDIYFLTTADIATKEFVPIVVTEEVEACVDADCVPYRCGATNACATSCADNDGCNNGYACSQERACLVDANSNGTPDEEELPWTWIIGIVVVAVIATLVVLFKDILFRKKMR